MVTRGVLKKQPDKHFRIQLMSLTKLASFLRNENEATVFESHYASILAKMFSALPKQVQDITPTP